MQIINKPPSLSERLVCLCAIEYILLDNHQGVFFHDRLTGFH